MDRITRRRGIVVALWVVALSLLAGAAYGAIGGVGLKTGQPDPPTKHGKSAEARAEHPKDDAGEQGEGVHGGPKARMHDACSLASGLEGNWTHGDYVSAVAKANHGDSEQIQAAAHSDCGKVDHG
jgi:hypothetical protein